MVLSRKENASQDYIDSINCKNQTNINVVYAIRNRTPRPSVELFVLITYANKLLRSLGKKKKNCAK